MSSMTEAVDELLGADEIDNITLVPVGSWRSELLSVTRKSPKNEDANYSYRYIFTFEPQAPGDDVDPDEAAAFLESEDADGARLFWTAFVSNKRDVLRLKRMLEKLGFKGSVEDAREEINGGIFALVDVTHEPGQDGEPRETVAAVAAVD